MRSGRSSGGKAQGSGLYWYVNEEPPSRGHRPQLGGSVLCGGNICGTAQRPSPTVEFWIPRRFEDYAVYAVYIVGDGLCAVPFVQRRTRGNQGSLRLANILPRRRSAAKVRHWRVERGAPLGAPFRQRSGGAVVNDMPVACQSRAVTEPQRDAVAQRLRGRQSWSIANRQKRGLGKEAQSRLPCVKGAVAERLRDCL